MGLFIKQQLIGGNELFHCFISFLEEPSILRQSLIPTEPPDVHVKIVCSLKFDTISCVEFTLSRTCYRTEIICLMEGRLMCLSVITINLQ